MSSLHVPPAVGAYLVVMAPFFAATAVVLVLLALAFLLILSRRLEKMSGGTHGSLEDILTRLSRDVGELQQFRGELEQYLKTAEARLHTSLRGVGVVRFNAFQNGAGGNQSFAIALLDEKLSGVVFSTLYSRDRVGVYAKPIENGSSKFTLSAEEQEAVDKARATLGIKTKREQ